MITSILSSTSLMSASATSSNFLTATPIKHLVIIFQENVSFDHYFATYTNATNPAFHRSSVNGLTSEMLTHNPNLVNPFKIPRSKALTCSNDHSYTRLQEAYHGGSISLIGKTDKANHQYDLTDFWNSVESGNNNSFPSVSFLKASAYQDGHSRYSDPLDEQHFLVDTINRLQKLAEWNSTAVIITYDDSDGWYDHVMPPIVSQSNDQSYDSLLGSDGLCGNAPIGAYQDRCGYGPRLPLLMISPYAKVNYVDHGITDQTSIIHFIEDNWGLGRIGNQSFDVKAGSIMNMFNLTAGHYANKLILNASTGIEK